MAQATTTKNAATTTEATLPERLYGKFSRKRGLTVRPDLPEGAQAFRPLTEAQVDAFYDVLEGADQDRYGYLLDKLEAGKAVRFSNVPGKPHKLLEAAKKAAGF